MMMQRRANIYSRLALVLLSLVVLELVLIGDQVQPVKGLKKKIFLKKLKKMLPLLALVKPKKKIILVPIPLPMFKNPGLRQQPAQAGAMSTAPSGTSLVMVGEPMGSTDPQLMMPMIMQPELLAGSGPLANGSLASPSSMSMSVQPDGTSLEVAMIGGGVAANTSTGALLLGAKRPSSAPLRFASSLLPPQFQQQQHHHHHHHQWFEDPQHLESFGETLGAEQALLATGSGGGGGSGGDHYYASPWAQAKLPSFSSPAKLLRAAASQRLRAPPVVQTLPMQQAPLPVSTATRWPTAAAHLVPVLVRPPARPTGFSGRLQQQQQQQQQQTLQPAPQPPATPTHTHTHYPMVVIRNEWRPMAPVAPVAPVAVSAPVKQAPHQQHQQQQLEQHEPDVLEPAGPPMGLLRVFQTSDGRLRMSPPPPPLPPAQQADQRPRPQANSDEVQLLGGSDLAHPSAAPTSGSGDDLSGRQQHQNQNQNQNQNQQHQAAMRSSAAAKLAPQSQQQMQQSPQQPIQQTALLPADYRR